MPSAAQVEGIMVKLTGDGASFQNMLRQAEVATKNFQQKVIGLGTSITSLGKIMTFGLTLPLVGFAAGTVKAFSSFDSAMTKSTSIMKVTQAQIDKMRQTALQMSSSGELQQGPAALAESYFFLASAGKDAEQSMALLPVVSKFATAGAFDMALATDLLTDAQSALGLSSKDTAQDMLNMTRVSDVLIKANTLANASAQQFAESLTTKSAAALKVFNKDVEEGVAVLAAYADQGIKGANSGENLNRVMTLLAATSRDAADMHERFGLKVFDSSGKMRNLADIIENLEDITDGMSDEVRSATLSFLGFEARVQATILPLLGSSQAIKDYEKALRDAGGTTEDVAKKQMESFASQMERLKNRVNVLGIEIGEKLIPYLNKLVDAVKAGLDKWNNLDDSIKDVVIQVGIFVAVVGPALLIIGKLISALGLLLTPFGLIATATVLAAAAFPEFREELKTTVVEAIRLGKELLNIVGLQEKLGLGKKSVMKFGTQKAAHRLDGKDTLVGDDSDPRLKAEKAIQEEMEQMLKEQESVEKAHRAQQTLKELEAEMKLEKDHAKKLEAMKKKGQALTAQFLPEEEKTAQLKQEYKELWETGNIGAETYLSALEELERQSNKDYQIHQFGISDSALAGTSAAFEKLAQFGELRGSMIDKTGPRLEELKTQEAQRIAFDKVKNLDSNAITNAEGTLVGVGNPSLDPRASSEASIQDEAEKMLAERMADLQRMNNVVNKQPAVERAIAQEVPNIQEPLSRSILDGPGEGTRNIRDVKINKPLDYLLEGDKVAQRFNPDNVGRGESLSIILTRLVEIAEESLELDKSKPSLEVADSGLSR